MDHAVVERPRKLGEEHACVGFGAKSEPCLFGRPEAMRCHPTWLDTPSSACRAYSRGRPKGLMQTNRRALTMFLL